MSLYIVRVEFEFAVVADSGRGAIDFTDEAVGDVFLNDYASVERVTSASAVKHPQGWSDETLVYGASEDVKLGEVVARLETADEER